MDEKSVVRQQLHLLLTAYGYNLYNSANRARADDLLVRQRACSSLGDAANHLSQLATDYHQRCIPPSTRENPFPPPEKMAQLHQIERLRDQVSLLASRIRGMSVPTQDGAWARFRNEESTLHSLLDFDYRLVVAASGVYDEAAGIKAENWSEDKATQITSLLSSLEQVARDREQFLMAPF